MHKGLGCRTAAHPEAVSQQENERGDPPEWVDRGKQIEVQTATSVDRSSKATLLRTVPRPNHVVCKGFMTASGRNCHLRSSSTRTSLAYSESGDARSM